MRLLTVVLVAISLLACSDRVPAPTTPTPTPRPGYPPAPVSELPEGVLFVSKPDVLAPLLFRFEAEREAEKIGAMGLGPVSPDGSRAVAQTYDGKSVVEIGLMTGGRYEAIAEGRWLMGSPSFVWSKNGRRLAYMLPKDADARTFEVWALDTETGEKRLVSPEVSSYWLRGWADAGDALLFNPEDIVLLGEKPRAFSLPEPGIVVDSAISPDGRSLAVKLGEYEYSEADQVTYVHSSGVWIGELADGHWRLVLDLAGEPPDVQTIAPTGMRWSPDGRRITVHRTRMDDSGMIADSLSVLDVETGKETLVHEQGWGFESWSPDGRYLAYWYEGNVEAGQPGRQLGIMGPDGRKRESDAHPRAMAWAMNGQLLLDVPGHLSLLDPGTMRMEDVLTGDGKDISAIIDQAVWSPSGRYAAVSTPADQYHRSSLYVVDTEEGTAELFLEEAGFSAVAWLRE